MSSIKIDDILELEKQISYEECRQLWEDENTLVHQDTSERIVNEVTRHIITRCGLNKDDVLLNVGCGDGLFDKAIIKIVKTLLGIDFSLQKISVAKNRVPEGIYYNHSFLETYPSDLKKFGITKIYSYEVVQYCNPDDIERFIINQLKLCTEDREYVVCHLDIPDIDKAHLYYQRIAGNDCPVSREMLAGRVKTLFGDGSYWHSMEQFESVANRYGLNCEIGDAHYWDYRSDVCFRFNGKEIQSRIWE